MAEIIFSSFALLSCKVPNDLLFIWNLNITLHIGLTLPNLTQSLHYFVLLSTSAVKKKLHMLNTAIAPQLFTIAFEQRGKKNWPKSCTLAVVPETIIRSVVIFKKKKDHPTIKMLPVLSSIFRFQDLLSYILLIWI